MSVQILHTITQHIHTQQPYNTLHITHYTNNCEIRESNDKAHIISPSVVNIEIMKPSVIMRSIRRHRGCVQSTTYVINCVRQYISLFYHSH